MNSIALVKKGVFFFSKCAISVDALPPDINQNVVDEDEYANDLCYSERRRQRFVAEVIGKHCPHEFLDSMSRSPQPPWPSSSSSTVVPPIGPPQHQQMASASGLPHNPYNQLHYDIVPGTSGQDKSSMSAILLAPLNEFQNLSHKLFLSLSTQNKPPPPPPLYAFLACDQSLAKAVNLAQKHQIKQKRIEELEGEILDMDARWKDMCIELEAEKKELDEIMDEGKERIRAIEDAKKGMWHIETSPRDG